MPPLRLLTYTTLYPHAGAPNSGIFVENRLRHLVATGQAQSVVLAPTPIVPGFAMRNPEWAKWTGAHAVEQRHGLRIEHPKFVLLPRGMNVAPWLLYRSSVRPLARLLRAGHRFDLIDAHYAYPDGVAAVWLARRFGLPVSITVRGSDVTEIGAVFRWPRLLLRRAFAAADAIITVSAGLRDAVTELGVPPEKVTVLRNGVDLDAFRPADRAAARAALGLDGPTLLSVGHLEERKGHALVIEALAELPGWRLLIVGSGPDQAALQALARRLGVEDRVRLVGQVPHAELPRYYTAADMLVLASKLEGWANVLLESMACGTPVLASPISGNPEVVQERAAGLVMAERTARGIVLAVRDLAADLPSRAATRAYAERFDWAATSQGQLDLFRAVLARRRAKASGSLAADSGVSWGLKKGS
jgi:teichuronic acid biosynthesis glycosyltransferase TuaC